MSGFFILFYFLSFFKLQLTSSIILASSVQHSVRCLYNLRSDPPVKSSTRVSVLPVGFIII